MNDASQFHKEGFNCAESIIKAFNRDNNLNIPVSIASPFGLGMAVQSTCGAVTGALMAMGSVKGRNEASVQNKSRKIAKEIMNKVTEKYGTFECSKLKQKGISCDEIIDYTYEILKDYAK
ncbi:MULTISPECIES: C-GCAxxG-C-C family (seleno)protein [Clostridium]|uniref:C-GCAxxG-C-C family protein n=2 Tax=Clostridium TaxID=1485 RepID=A0ABM5NU93_9CLOT|nr:MULTISPECIES: C-GCAxxG-C-C family (seleno)protein [Clostridium]ADK16989.1 putative membrane protein [Clostridium ljungdahlii DSM 13528]AGY76030.1 C-GCAxxG-C-C family protein [Clostridium autoethanogenum DSM 10061]ALU36193.1 Alcohol dehydrogenase [Clostridium autoethanogenum DSM 10061]OAA85367.1 putative redox-active protein (C_GCAxxG_C_C) [Clostridium ljungdahlii DSM 13528]OVY51749.1 putative redox-active protein (C_GCAxxG_C_C) [Clostridium autoethanogenum]